MNEYSRRLHELTERTIKPSGHAFVCLDSPQTADACVSHFRSSGLKICKYFAHSLRKNLTKRIKARDPQTRGSLPDETQVASHLDLVSEYRKRGPLITSHPVAEPCDIIWLNIRGRRDYFLLRRTLLTTVMVVILVFISTPAVFLARIHDYDSQGLLDLDGWARE